jgi:hypothetical protein
MVSTRPFLYLSVLNFTCRTSRQNRLFRVSKSRNGDSRGTFNLRDRAVRIAAILSLFGRERFRSARKNMALGHSTYASVTGGSFTVPLGQAHSEDSSHSAPDSLNLWRNALLRGRRSLWRWGSGLRGVTPHTPGHITAAMASAGAGSLDQEKPPVLEMIQRGAIILPPLAARRHYVLSFFRLSKFTFVRWGKNILG